MEEKPPWEINAGLVDLTSYVGRVWLFKVLMDLYKLLSALGMGLRKPCAKQHYSGISTGLRRRHTMLYGDLGLPASGDKGAFSTGR